MAVSFGAAGTSASGTTSCTPSYPSGISATTSKLYCFVTGRSNTEGNSPTMPAGWTNIADFVGGTGTWGVDTGTRRVTVFKKDTVTGSESGTQTVSLSGTSANTMRATIARFEATAGYSIQEAFSTGADTSHGTSFSATGSSSIDWATDDLLAIVVAQNVDSATQSSQAISASGVTFGTRTNQRSNAVTNGNDHRHILDTVPVTTGSGSSAPTYSYTASANASGPVAFLRLRETPLSPTVLTKGTNGSAASSATTASVTTTSGKAQLLAVAVTPDSAGADTDFTIAGWTKVHQRNFNPADLERSVSLWSKAGAGGSESATITAPAGETYLEFRWIWVEWGGLGSLAQPTSANGNSAAPSVTLGSFGAGSGTLEAIGSAGGLNPTVGSGFTHLDEQVGTVEGDCLTVGWRADADTSVDASSSSGSDYWGIIGVELVPGTWGGGSSTGTLAATESGTDAFAATGVVIVSGALVANEAGADTFAATGDVLAQGALAATESGSDAFAAAGGVLVQGAVAATESGADAFAATGNLIVSGSVAAAEAGTDVLSASGSVIVQGSLATVETGGDTFSASGGAGVSGSLVAIEAGSDAASISGVVLVAGLLAAVESGADTASLVGQILVAGALAAVEPAADGFAADGTTGGGGSTGQPVHELDITSKSPLWWQRRGEAAEKALRPRRRAPVKPAPAGDAAERARHVIEQAARRHVEAGDVTLSKDARYADVRLALKPLGQSRPPEWAAMYEALYSLALNDAIARELEIEAQLQDEDDALILLMMEP